jgi:hypothetical protein
VIDWLLINNRAFVRHSRWMMAGCAFALIAIASLPHNAVDRVLALIGLATVGVIFLLWLGVVLVTLVRPRLFDEMRRRRSIDR